MSIYLISLRPATIEWIQQHTQVDWIIEHLDIKITQAGDTVIGTLSVHLAAQVYGRGRRYYHLNSKFQKSSWELSST